MTGNRVDFSRAHGFIGRMNQPSRPDALAGLMSRLLLATGLVLMLTGCVTTQSGGSAAPEKVATLEVQAPSAAPSPENREIACQIQLIDGAKVASSDRLRPGHHRLVVALGGNEGEYTGDVDLVIPAARDYRLKAEREDDTFTLSLIETDTGKVVATSSAQADQIMSFQVFVIQK